MTLINGDCLEEMKDLSDNSIDFLFADLPYGQTSCKWDCLIDLDLFWKQANRVCKQEAVMAFTCSVKFGNSLINSNPKCFRYDLVWVKSAPCGFLNAKKMPMKKHEMVYIFYRKLPKVYTENIALHHKHKFLKETKNVVVEKRDVEGLYGEEKDKIRFKVNGKLRDSEPRYTPPLPNSVIKEELCNYDVNKNAYGGGKDGRIKISKNKEDHQQKYDPPLPNSVIKEENVVVETNHNTLYGNIDIANFEKRKNGESRYNPPLPNTIMEIKSEKGKHATQKPVALMEWLIKYYTREGDVVLDPTMGSGGTGIACKNLNREFIGIEKDEEIYKIAVERNS
jgi:DNA modification methylase